uniref:Tektin n=1 Tax=Bubo bubo TaxID=30461 RepID=A0A8C0FQZ9_BUBBB
MMGTTQLASYCGTKKSCLFPGLAPTSTTKDTYQSYYLPGYRYLSSWGPSLLYKVASVPPSSDKQFNPIGQPPTVVPSLCSALHARYSTRDWHHANMVQLKSSEDSRECAGRLNADSMRLMQDKDQLTYQMQKDSRRNLGERISTTDFWRSELIYELECLLKETQDLETTKKRLDCAADEMKEPLKAGFTYTTALTVVQSKVFPFHSINRDAQHVREQDLCDKNSAHLIEEKCFKLRNTSDSINFFHGVKKADGIQHKGSLQRGLVAVIPICFSAFSVQLLSALTVTSLMYSGNCLELTNMFCFVQILQEIFRTEDTVMLLERSIKAKEYPLKVAQTRLEERTKQPNIELCRDAPQFSVTIDDTLQILKRRLQEAHDTLQMLLYKSKLEHEISVKANSFFIDKKCMDMRKVFPSTP